MAECDCEIEDLEEWEAREWRLSTEEEENIMDNRLATIQCIWEEVLYPYIADLDDQMDMMLPGDAKELYEQVKLMSAQIQEQLNNADDMKDE